jgi:phosphohistidine phosphatase
VSGKRRLLLLRHAKAVASRPGMSDASDHGRPLSERGRLDAAAMGRKLRSLGLVPALALVSTALRTRETFDLLGPFEGDAPRQILSDALYLAEPRALLDVVQEEGDTAESVMLVGHNPGLHELALTLAGGNPVLEQGFPTCSLAVFKVEGKWSELSPRHASLKDVLRP